MALLAFASLAVLLAAAPAANARAWTRPLQGPVLRPFSVSADRFARGQHRGVDLGAPPGTRVRAACAGRVTFAGRVPGGGLTLSVRCGPLVATYQHLGALAARGGQVVARGALVGAVGDGRLAHVHLGARWASSGRYVDPLVLISAPSRTVAPPLGPAPRARRPPLAPRPRFGRSPLARALPANPPAARALPLSVWVGLASVGFGVPLGAIVTVRRRRRVQRHATAVRTAA